jgi:hypothetical protein
MLMVVNLNEGLGRQVKYTKLLGKPFNTRRTHGKFEFCSWELISDNTYFHKLDCSTASYKNIKCIKSSTFQMSFKEQLVEVQLLEKTGRHV